MTLAVTDRRLSLAMPRLEVIDVEAGAVVAGIPWVATPVQVPTGASPTAFLWTMIQPELAAAAAAVEAALGAMGYLEEEAAAIVAVLTGLPAVQAPPPPGFVKLPPGGNSAPAAGGAAPVTFPPNTPSG